MNPELIDLLMYNKCCKEIMLSAGNNIRAITIIEEDELNYNNSSLINKFLEKVYYNPFDELDEGQINDVFKSLSVCLTYIFLYKRIDFLNCLFGISQEDNAVIMKKLLAKNANSSIF